MMNLPVHLDNQHASWHMLHNGTVPQRPQAIDVVQQSHQNNGPALIAVPEYAMRVLATLAACFEGCSYQKTQRSIHISFIPRFCSYPLFCAVIFLQTAWS